MTAATWVILGAGYTGGQLAERLVRDGQRVIVTRRDPANARAAEVALGVTADAKGVAMDLSRPETLVFPDDAIVVCLAPPGDNPTAEIEGLVHAARGSQRLVYVSSTAVYGAGGGQVVDESWPLAPLTAAGRARVAAEGALPKDAISLRASGIYGPGRGIFERIRAGTFRIVGDGRAHVSRIHVTDLVDAIVRAGATTFAGPVNIADDEPAPAALVADAIATRLGVPLPPRIPVDQVDPEVAGMLTADRRISNKRMKEKLGVVLRYPSWRTLLTEWSGPIDRF